MIYEHKWLNLFQVHKIKIKHSDELIREIMGKANKNPYIGKSLK